MIEAPPPMSLSGADDDAGADPALDHRRAERAGVEVDEALVHDRGALGQVRAEPHPVAVGDAHAGGDRRSRPSAGTCRRRTRSRGRRRARSRCGVEPGGLDRAGAGPRHVGEQPEDAGHVRAVRPDQPVREQVQPQPDVVGVGRRRGQVGDDRADGDDLDAARLVAADQAAVVGAELAGELQRAEPRRPGLRAVGCAEPGLRVPGVEDRARRGDGREAGGDGGGGGGMRSRATTLPRPRPRRAAGPEPAP